MSFPKLSILAIGGLLALTGCHRNAEGQGPMERTGMALDRAGQDTGQALGRAADSTGRALNRAGQDTGAALERSGNWVRNQTQ
ncbi:hypothetical protein [Roseococcus sp. YIM B11640]|uniref:hypothetical protein n=1 Tax=Roseococcus sp. YIM B11640 TaxID=3133973 RepID=UPI003C7D35EA